VVSPRRLPCRHITDVRNTHFYELHVP
jgi:hypothetical protein